MLKKRRNHPTSLEWKHHAPLFAALGDETRLSLVAKLCKGEPHSISELSKDAKVTRQAITKHLRVLEGAGLVRSVQRGRENVFEFKPDSLDRLKKYIEVVSLQWDQALLRLKSFVED